MNRVQHFTANQRRYFELLTFTNDVRQGKVHFGFNALLNLPQRTFAVVELPRFGEFIDRGEPFIEGITRMEIGRMVFREPHPARAAGSANRNDVPKEFSQSAPARSTSAARHKRLIRK